MSTQGPSQGFLVLADISGYTAFLTGTELEHAHAIVHELTALIRDALSPPMRFVKLEGDAVFCYAGDAAFRNGERLLEMIEVCYFRFANRLQDMTLATTCRCDACAAMGSLGLKFIVHHGTFVVERDGKSEDLTGPDVILAHRLLKNTVSENGPKAYALITDAALLHMPASISLPRHAESYESFGEVTGGVHDLAPVYAAMREERREHISAAEADFEQSIELPVPPAIAWRYYADPVERKRWACRYMSKEPDEAFPNSQGRLGAGAKSHCGHGGSALREFVEWRPFEFWTCHTETPAAGAFVSAKPAIETVEFIPIDGGTRVIGRMRVKNRGRIAMLALRAARPAFNVFWRRANAALLQIVEEDRATLGLDATK